MRYQIAGYRIAFEEEHGDQFDGGVILHFDKESGVCTPHEYSREELMEDGQAFLACLALKKREKVLAKA
jgi:hypothetical protein